AADLQNTKQYALDNPRIETLWEYLKRLHHYRTGIVTTADVTDATPAGEGGHTITRNLLKDIAAQYVDGPFVPGPTFDVILGGGLEQFTQRTVANTGDTRNLATELQGLGYTYVQNRAQLNGIAAGTTKLLGLFRTSHMNVAYDKLGLVRPPDEPAPVFGGFTDQPFLDEMTEKAIDVLSAGDSPFILMVEGASIDKQSHPNHAAGVIWDTIEFDKAIGVGRAFAAPKKNEKSRTLVMVSADHDQSMSIVGVTDTLFAPPAPLPAPPAPVPFPVQNTRSPLTYPVVNPPASPFVGVGSNPGEVSGFPDYADADADGYPENTNRYRLAVGFRSGNHTGSSVPLTAEGPGALLFTGYYDQTDIFFKTARVLSIDTDELDRCLREVQRQQPSCESPKKGPRKLRDWLIRKHVDPDCHD
ncbi:MAG: alkaline phosphatase, partial [Planctomycetaceae bacterium]|nr:alkaline phosphatase [Planctomycetaceae bacterium]